MPSNRLWIMDGHNMIFALPPLQRLQVSDRRAEARAGLTDRLERFAIARGERVLVVFDGNEMPSNPEADRRTLMEIVYTRRGEAVADDRILQEARVRRERGQTVTVVTNDVRTLARELPRGVNHLGVEAFWLKYIEPEVGEGGKRVEGDFSDVERDMLAQAAGADASRAAGASPVSRGRAEPEAAATPARGRRHRPAGEEALRERIRLKRERGRLRQERRLGRHAKRSRRP
jgi:predicted RNA-binding protein with PIN domain